MKKLFTFLLVLLAFSLHTLAQDKATLVLHHADGTTTDVALYLKPRVVFEGDKVRITSTVLDMEYPKSNVLRFSYKGSGTGITAPKNEADYTRDGDRLVFHGISSADKVAVYTTNGIRVPVRLSAASDGVTLSLSSIPQGVYVLSVNGKTSKFARP
jgi:ribosomal protein L2